MSAPLPCGTNGGYVRHQKERTAPCEPCKAARARYMREYRATHDRSEDAMVAAARTRAQTRLAARYPGVFNRLFMEEIRASREAWSA